MTSRTPNDHRPPTYDALCPNGARSIQPGATPLDRIGRRFSPVRAEYINPKHDFRLGGGLPLPVRRRVDKLSASTIIPQSRVRASTTRVAIPRFHPGGPWGGKAARIHLALPVRRRVDKRRASTIIPQSRVRASTTRVAIPRFHPGDGGGWGRSACHKQARAPSRFR